LGRDDLGSSEATSYIDFIICDGGKDVAQMVGFVRMSKSKGKVQKQFFIVIHYYQALTPIRDWENAKLRGKPCVE
jgi:hypothetical protein